MPDDDKNAGPGHNATAFEVSEERYHAFMASHMDLDEQIAVLKGKRKKLRKTMQADGIILGDFDAALRMSTMSRHDVEQHFRHLRQYMIYNRHPLGTQFRLDLEGDGAGEDFEDEAKVQARAAETAIQDGFLAGLSNHPMSKNPHDGNTAAGQAWIKAWHDGQARRAHESIEPHDDDDGKDVVEPEPAPKASDKPKPGRKPRSSAAKGG